MLYTSGGTVPFIMWGWLFCCGATPGISCAYYHCLSMSCTCIMFLARSRHSGWERVRIIVLIFAEKGSFFVKFVCPRFLNKGSIFGLNIRVFGKRVPVFSIQISIDY